MKILQEEQHSTLVTAYDEITGDHQKMSITTRFAVHGELTSIYANSQVYHVVLFDPLLFTARLVELGDFLAI